jgi:hypothetical protein
MYASLMQLIVDFILLQPSVTLKLLLVMNRWIKVRALQAAPPFTESVSLNCLLLHLRLRT